MFAWFVKRAADNEVFDVMNQAFTEDEYLTQIMAIVDADIARTPESSEYAMVSLVQCRCDLMKRLHMSEKEQQAYRRQFLHIHGVRDIEIDCLTAKRRYNEAIVLVREGQQQDDKVDSMYTSRWTRRLLELLRQSGNTDEYRQELCTYVLDTHQNNLDYVRELKRLTPSEDWPTLRDELLLSENLRWTTRYDFLRDEKMYEQLFNELMTSRSPDYVWQYEKPLRSLYPLEMRDILVNLLNHEMASTGTRDHYRTVIARLPVIAAYPDGKATVRRMVAAWAATYARRSAMLEELRKAGYLVSK